MGRSVASLKRDPRFGLDSRWSWITAGFLSWVLFIGTSSVRVAGVLFYGIVETYGVTRQEASWPVTLNGCLLNLGGPVMGMLCRRFSCRAVILTCSFMTGIAVSVCYFAEGVLFLNIFFGIIHGERRTSLRRPSAAQISRSAVIDDWTGSVNSFGALDFGPASQNNEERPEKTLKETARQFLTVSFLVDAVSFTIVVFGMGTFILLSVDLGKDRGILPSDAVYLLHAFSAGDITFRALCGFVIDSGLLSLEAVMVLGYLMQAFAFEFLVWAGTFPMMLLGSVLIGVSNGSRISLQAPSLIKDFGVESLPVMMGGMVFCIGAGSLLRPALIGHYRDHHGSYSGLLHIVAVINAVMVGVWTVKLIFSRRKASKAKADFVSEEENKRPLSVSPDSGKAEDNCDV